jgi:hypothetical protein
LSAYLLIAVWWYGNCTEKLLPDNRGCRRTMTLLANTVSRNQSRQNAVIGSSTNRGR